MNIDWNRLRKGALILFCAFAAAGSLRGYLQGTARQETAVLYETPVERAEIPALEEYKDDRIDLNAATIEQLCTLKGIGPAKAQAILDYRSDHGPFGSIEELQNVSGIKGAVFQKLAGRITV